MSSSCESVTVLDDACGEQDLRHAEWSRGALTANSFGASLRRARQVAMVQVLCAIDAEDDPGPALSSRQSLAVAVPGGCVMGALVTVITRASDHITVLAISPSAIVLHEQRHHHRRRDVMFVSFANM